MNSDKFDTRCTRDRTILDLSPLGQSDLPVIGSYRYPAAHPPLPAETHPEHFELVYVESGEQQYQVAGEFHQLRGGDLLLIPPGQRHSTAGRPEGKGAIYWWFIRQPAPGRCWLGFDAAATSALTAHFLRAGIRITRANRRLQACLRQLFQLAPAGLTPIGRAEVFTALQALILAAAECLGATPEDPLSLPIAQVLKFLREQRGWTISLEDLARRAGLSLPRFKVRFREEVGIAPSEYLMRRRLEEAKQRLRPAGPSITEIAMDLEFSTSQYFATVFKRFEGCSPLEWHRRQAGVTAGEDATAAKPVRAGASDKKAAASLVSTGRVQELSPREREILNLLAQGFLYKEIAEQLRISFATVHTHITRLYEKMGVQSRAQAVARFLRR